MNRLATLTSYAPSRRRACARAQRCLRVLLAVAFLAQAMGLGLAAHHTLAHGGSDSAKHATAHGCDHAGHQHHDGEPEPDQEHSDHGCTVCQALIAFTALTPNAPDAVERLAPTGSLLPDASDGVFTAPSTPNDARGPPIG